MDGVHVTGPNALDEFIARITNARREPVVVRTTLLSEDTYRSAPTLLDTGSRVSSGGTHELATFDRADRYPGTGKTLVGLQTMHAKYLDDFLSSRGRSFDGVTPSPDSR